MMNNPQYPFGHTSNDLLFSLEGESSRKTLNYEIVAQSGYEVQDIQNAPAVSMGPYLIDSRLTQVRCIRIQSKRHARSKLLRICGTHAMQ